MTGWGTGTIRNRDRSQRGLTLVELLVTIVLSSLFFAAMVPVFVLASKTSSADRGRVVAVNIGQSKIELIRDLSYEQLSTTYLNTEWPDRMADGNYRVTYAVVPTLDGNDDEIAWDITVRVASTLSPPLFGEVVLKTVVAKQFDGAEISAMRFSPEPKSKLSLFDGKARTVIGPGGDGKIWITVRVSSNDVGDIDRVEFSVSAANGTYSSRLDAVEATADQEEFTSSWTPPDTARDGKYVFTAVAFADMDEPGNAWRRILNLDTGGPDVSWADVVPVWGGNRTSVLSWKTPMEGDLHHFQVWRGSPGAVALYRDDLPLWSHTFVDRDLPAGTYTYQVRAVDEFGQPGSPSEEGNAIVISEAPTPPSVPLMSLAPDGQSIIVRWGECSDDVGVAGYRVYRSTLGGDVNLESPVAVVPSSQRELRDLVGGWLQSRSYRVGAYDAGLNEAVCDSISGLTDAQPAPDQRFELTVQVSTDSPKGQDAKVQLYCLTDWSLYPPYGPVTIQKNTKGWTVSNLRYGWYRVFGEWTSGAAIVKDFELTSDRIEWLSL